VGTANVFVVGAALYIAVHGGRKSLQASTRCGSEWRQPRDGSWCGTSYYGRLSIELGSRRSANQRRAVIVTMVMADASWL